MQITLKEARKSVYLTQQEVVNKLALLSKLCTTGKMEKVK